MSVLDTILCDWPGCPSDAAPDALYCPRHAERFSRGELPPRRTCQGSGCRRDALEGTVFCAECNRERLAVSELAAIDEGGRVLCHYDGCDELALEATIGARRQGGRYEICRAHLDALNEKARDTRRRNRESLPAAGSVPAKNENGNNPPLRIRADDGAFAPIATEPDAPDLPLIRQHAQGCMLEQSHDGECYVPGAPTPSATPSATLPATLEHVPCHRADDDPHYSHEWTLADDGSGERVVHCPGIAGLPRSGEPSPPWPGPVPEGPFQTELVGGWVTLEEDKIQLEERVLDAWGEALAAVYLAIGEECGKADGTITGARNLAALAAELLAQGATINRALTAVASAE